MKEVKSRIEYPKILDDKLPTFFKDNSCIYEVMVGKYYKCTHPNYVSWAKKEGEENIMFGDSCTDAIKAGFKCPYECGELK